MDHLLFGIVTFVCLIIPVQSVCPNSWTKYEDVCYRLYQASIPWLQASSMCLEFGGHLAKLDTQRKIDNAKQFLTYVNHGNSVWIGANDFRSESVWKWDTDQSSFNVTDWDAGEPNGDNNDNCLVMAAHKGFKWGDAPCDRPFDYLCERISS